MTSELSLETFRYFIECHFNIDRDYSELKKVVLEFKETENPRCLQNLLRDIKIIINLNDWNYIHEFMYQYGLRSYEEDKLKQMIWTIYGVLSE